MNCKNGNSSWSIFILVNQILVSVALIFVTLTIINYGEATQTRLDAIQQKIEANRSTETTSTLTATDHLSHISPEQQKWMRDIMIKIHSFVSTDSTNSSQPDSP